MMIVELSFTLYKGEIKNVNSLL